MMNSTQCSGLFLDDYMDILNICQPHYLINKLSAVLKASTSNKPVSTNLLAQKLISNLTTSKFLNSILLRENYSWKKSFTYKAKSTRTCQQFSEEKSSVITDGDASKFPLSASAQALPSKDSNKVSLSHFLLECTIFLK